MTTPGNPGGNPGGGPPITPPGNPTPGVPRRVRHGLRKPCPHGLYDPHYWETTSGYPSIARVVTFNCPGGETPNRQELQDAYREAEQREREES